MAFERFTKIGGRSHTPKVAIWSKGQLGFNKGAVNKWDLDKYEFAIMFFDKDERKIAVQFTQDASSPGAIKIVKRPTGISFSASAFFQYYDIPHEKTEKYDVEFDKEADFFIISLQK